MKNLFNYESRFFNIGKKIITGILVFATVFSFTFSVRIDSNFSNFSFQPEKVEAVPSFDIANFIKEIILDLISWIAANLMVTFASFEIVKWANENFGGITFSCTEEGDEVICSTEWDEGDPSFLTNPEEFFRRIASDSINASMEGIEVILSNLGKDSPLQLDPQLTATLDSIIQQKHFKPFEERMRMTVSPEKIADFMEDFTHGGWGMWTEILINPQNTPRGALILAEQEIERRLREAIEHTERELMEGGGFLASRRCVEDAYDPSHPDADAFGCIEYEDVTPGSVIESQVIRALGMDIERLAAADEITEVIANLLTKTFINLIEEGLTSVKSGYDLIEAQKRAAREAAEAEKRRDREEARADSEMQRQGEAAVSAAERSRTQEDIDYARGVIESISDEDKKQELQDRLDEIEPLEGEDQTENGDAD